MNSVGNAHLLRGAATRQRVLLVIILLALIVLPRVVTQSFVIHILILFFLYAILGSSWNILGGYTGQVSLGHSIYFGFGAYVSTLLAIERGVSPWLGMWVGAATAILVALVIGYPSFFLGGRYFAVATLVLGQIVLTVFMSWNRVGAALGLFVPMRAESWINFQFHSSKLPYYYIVLCMLCFTIGAVSLISRSWLGYYFRAIKSEPDAARSLGINLTMYKLIALALSVFFASIAGTFYAQYVLYIDPSSVLSPEMSVMMMFIPALGGIGTLWGPIIGAAVLVPLAEINRLYLGGSVKGTHLIVYGVLIIIIAVAQPNGLVAVARGMRRKVPHGIVGSR